MYLKVWITIVISSFVSKGQANCEFPCELRGQTFNIHFEGNGFRLGNWSFDNDGISSSLNIVGTIRNTTCFRRAGRFLILRDNNVYQCYVFDFKSSGNTTQVNFAIGNYGDENFDFCQVCRFPVNFTFEYIAIAPGASFTSSGILPCSLPSSCVGRDTCSVTDSIPEGCPPMTTNQSTTASQADTTTTTLTEATTTKKRKRCDRKRYRH
ncbi:uncharacterized protein LOC134724657 [Mytilus trossulus]|uniref:uncharacterized protein LOC134724657 n=1 Tax=Mytilus trossulus TaxID=6551 RepID=UPI003004D857